MLNDEFSEISSSAGFNGDIRLYGLEPQTGKVLWTVKGIASDLLVSSGIGFSIGGVHGLFDAKTGNSIKAKREGLPGQQPSLEAQGMGMLLDYSWHQIRGTIARFHFRCFAGLTGQTVICDDQMAYAYRRTGPKVGEVVARNRSEPAKDTFLWKLPAPEEYQVEALAVAGEMLLAAGPLSGSKEAKGELWLIDARDGRKLLSLPLSAAPVSEGIAVAGGRLYVSTRDGRILCFGKEQACRHG